MASGRAEASLKFRDIAEPQGNLDRLWANGNNISDLKMQNIARGDVLRLPDRCHRKFDIVQIPVPFRRGLRRGWGSVGRPVGLGRQLPQQGFQ
jgi:hypothetical protein